MEKIVLSEELKKRALPELFLTPDGKQISTKEEWENILRPYWREVLLREEYGRVPPYVAPEIQTERKYIDFAGKAVWETVSFRFNASGKEHVVPTQLIYPADGKKHPFFIYLNFRPDIPDIYLPVEELIDNGFGIFSVCYNDVTMDNDDFTTGLAALFQTGERTADDTGKIGYWSYMASRMMDYLQTRPEADHAAIGVAGHSRLGKTALLTAALDERFAFVCSNDSGCCGAALSRGRCEGGERVVDIFNRFPYWFSPSFAKYAEAVETMPFDQHCLLALVAPRAAYIGGAIQDVWADNDNQLLNCVVSSKAWELYGKTGIITPDRLPVCGDIFTDGDVGFHLRAGKHYHSRTDWLVYMDAVKKYLSR
jgi:hypothetical protein